MPHENAGFKWAEWSNGLDHANGAFVEWCDLYESDEEELMIHIGIVEDTEEFWWAHRDQLVLVHEFPGLMEVNSLTEVSMCMEHEFTYSDNLQGIDEWVGHVYVMRLRGSGNRIVAMSNQNGPYGFYMSKETLKELIKLKESM